MVPGPPAGTDHGFGHVPGGGGPFQLAGGDGFFLLQGGDRIAVPQLGIDPRLWRTNPTTGFPVNPVQRLQQGRWLAKPEGLPWSSCSGNAWLWRAIFRASHHCSCVALSTATAQAENDDMPLAALPELISQLEDQMKTCAQDVEFEEAAKLRDHIRILREKLVGSS